MGVGLTPSLPMELSAVPLSLVPLAFASAIVRYRLMDVEVIVSAAACLGGGGGRDRGTLPGPAARGDGRASGGGGQQWVIAILATLVVCCWRRAR